MAKKDKHPFRKYCNSYGMRFNCDSVRADKILMSVLSEAQQKMLQELWDLKWEQNAVVPAERFYNICTDMKQINALMTHQSDFFLEISKVLYAKIKELNPARVLELGCLSGLFSSFLAKDMPETHFTGIDCLDKMIAVGQNEFSLDNLELICKYYKDLPESGLEVFDTIFTSFGYEDIPTTSLSRPMDTIEIRKDKSYQAAFKYFLDRFKEIDEVSKEGSTFLIAIRIPESAYHIAMLDAAAESGWSCSENFKRINSKADGTGEESIPFNILTKNSSPEVNVEEVCDYWGDKSSLYLRHFYQNKMPLKNEWKKGSFDAPDGHIWYWSYGSNGNNFYSFTWATGGFVDLYHGDSLEDVEMHLDFLTNGRYAQ